MKNETNQTLLEMLLDASAAKRQHEKASKAYENNPNKENRERRQDAWTTMVDFQKAYKAEAEKHGIPEVVTNAALAHALND